MVLALTGSVIGFASGLPGIGYGFLMMPVQFWLLTKLGAVPTFAVRVYSFARHYRNDYSVPYATHYHQYRNGVVI